MKQYGLEEKLAYNRRKAARGDKFAEGYIKGVKLYRDYPAGDEYEQAAIRAQIDAIRSCIALDGGFERERGVMCGYRDAANERKAKAKARDAARRQQRADARARDEFFTSSNISPLGDVAPRRGVSRSGDGLS